MSSIVPGYNYDIFISYRQKDNKHDGWVTEFVENLKGELEATFKEEISVYFDINPHDGLLETHDVDESLKEKLKCLIFIPIISRTYCDPGAFAWEHEFRAFVEQASEDEYGLKVRLPNGNVASRVLPVVIYDLDRQDIKLFESVIGGALRGVEFIYKSAGVNRPLRSKEEKPHDNLNNTLYRDQVNKVGNTIKDILNSIARKELSDGEAIAGKVSEDKHADSGSTLKKKSKIKPSVSLLYRLRNLVSFNPVVWRITTLLFIAVSIVAVWLYMKKPSSSEVPQLRYDIPLTGALTSTESNCLAVSPDAEYLVFVINGKLYLKQLNSNAPAEPLAGITNARSPFFSPDSKWIGYENWQEGKIMKTPLTGGNPALICGLGKQMNQANWYEHEIIFSDWNAIYRVPDTGGIPELLYPINRTENDPMIWNPQLLPDKKTLLFSQLLEGAGWSLMSWRTGSKERPSVLLKSAMNGRYLKSGQIAYTFLNRLYICKFNPKTNRIISEPTIIETNPIWRYPIFLDSGSSQFDFSENGILVYYEEQGTNQSNLVWVDESGSIIPVTNVAKVYDFARISSDGQYIAAQVGGHIEKINTKTGNSQLFTENAKGPAWSADNSSIYYIQGDQVFQKPLDLSTPPVMLFELDSARNLGLYGISSDGKYLLFDALFAAGYDIGYYDIINKKSVMLQHYNHPGSDDHQPALSPDGRWIAYRSDYSGRAAIYVAPFPGPGQPESVTSPRSTNDIYYPVWAPDMTALYYYTDNPDFELWKVNMQFSEDDFTVEPAQSFFNGGSYFVSGYNFEIHPDGDRFLIRQIGNTSEPRIEVIANWEQEQENK